MHAQIYIEQREIFATADRARRYQLRRQVAGEEGAMISLVRVALFAQTNYHTQERVVPLGAKSERLANLAVG